MVAYKPEELSWLAAAIDGEGCLSKSIKTSNKNRKTQYNKIGYVLKLYNTNRNFVERAEEITGFGCINSQITTHRRSGCAVGSPRVEGKIMHAWIVAGQTRILYLLKDLLPYLIIKKEKAKEAIWWIETNIKANPTYNGKKLIPK